MQPRRRWREPPFKHDGPFIGETKGNKDRPIDLSGGTGGGHGGKHVAGRGRKDFTRQ